VEILCAGWRCGGVKVMPFLGDYASEVNFLQAAYSWVLGSFCFFVFICPARLCFLIGEFNPFTFKVSLFFFS
jgi:hypothetical protein